jgi:hypothetical protein
MLFVAAGVVAQEHDHSMMPLSGVAQEEHLAHLRELVASMSSHGPVIPQPDSVGAAAVKNFTITAKSFSFTVTPSPFAVNQGDVVNITLTVPSNDASSIGHGILMETYIEGGTDVARGGSKTIQFTATNSGTFAFVCNVPDCGTGHSSMFGTMIVNAVANPAPTISSISPTTGSTAGGTVVTIAGSGFGSTATVKIGGVAATGVSVPNSTSITATSPAHAAGKADVVVTNSDGQSATLAQAFTYAIPGPTITSISPNTGPTSGGTPVTITGTSFQSGATVTFGARAATDVVVVSATSITARTPLGPANEQLQVSVVVMNPDNSQATGTFNYTVAPLSVISVSPNVVLPLGAVGAGPVVVTIFGTGFTSAVNSSVAVGGVPATNVQIIDAMTMRATIPAHAAGTSDVIVTVGGSSVTVKNGFSWQNAPSRSRAVRH